ncbi:hypothetical protein AKO1_011789 [Acrasis kona]|uniref:Uncharacterized protein n=1 Tax=Acrasis kona TaxID=1008807 RepID=A0AAW2Z707_9EUKA
MLQSLECATILETSHCMLLLHVDGSSANDLTACHNRYIDESVAAYISLLERTETSISHSNILKDICSVVNSTRTKYNSCARLMENATKLTNNDEDRIYVLNTVFNIVCKCSLNTIVKRAYVMDVVGMSSELDKFFKEELVQYFLNAASNTFEQKLRCDVLYSACKQYLLLQPPRSNSELRRAWVELGIELCEHCKSCLVWNDCHGLNACVGEFGKVLTKMCAEVHQPGMNDTEEKKRVNKVLNQVLDAILNMQTEFAEIISMCILSNYVHLHKQVSGKESGDVVFDHVKFMLSVSLKQSGSAEKIKIDTLLYCLLCICSRSVRKLSDAHEFLNSALTSRKENDEVRRTLFSSLSRLTFAIENATNHDNQNKLLVSTMFHEDHPIFKSYATDEDEHVAHTYVKVLQMASQIRASQYPVCDSFIQNQKLKIVSGSSQLDNFSSSMIVSHGSDPVAITATYTLVPNTFTVYFYCKVQNISPMDMYQVSVDVGCTGGLDLFDKTPQSSQLIGELAQNTTFEFEREYIVSKLDHCAFHVILYASHTRGATGDMVSDMFGENNTPQHPIVKIRCRPLYIPLQHLLTCPKPMSQLEFLALWEISHVGFHKSITVDVNNIEGELGATSLNNKMIHFMSCSTAPLDMPSKHVQRWVNVRTSSHPPQYHHSFVTRTLFNDYVLVTLFGVIKGDHVHYDMEVRCADSHTAQVLNRDDQWLQHMSQRCSGVRVLNEFRAMNDGSMDSKVNISMMFGLNEAKLNVLNLQKWHSIVDTRNASTASE